MKILHIAMGTPELDRSARELGHDVERIEWPKIFDKAALNGITLSTFRRYRPDLVFMQLQTPGVLKPNVLDEMKGGAFVVNWCGDVRDPLPQHYIDTAPHVTVTAFTNEPDVEALRAMGFDSRFLQIGYDETIYKVSGYANRTAPPVVFMGSHYRDRFPLSGHRFELVEALRKELGHRFGVYGRGWPFPGVKLLKPNDEAAMYRGCKVAIHADHFDRPGFFSDRWLRAQACGAYTVNLTAIPVDEAVTIVKRVLEVDSRQEVAREMARKVREEETWHRRIEQLETWVNG
jgi:hypothetical protein